jgi:hypothetical protein
MRGLHWLYTHCSSRKAIIDLQSPFAMLITSNITLAISKFSPENMAEPTQRATALMENITAKAPIGEGRHQQIL